jgi:MFS family permease
MPGTTLIIAMFFFQALTTCLFFVVSIKLVLHIIDVSYVNTALSLGSMIGRGLGALTFQLVGGQLIERFGVNTLYQFLGVIGIIGIVLALCFPVGNSSSMKRSYSSY